MARKKDAEVRSGVKARRVTARRYIKGKRGTRNDIMPRKSVTVCAGTSWENAIRKDI
jgi:hypothetical protein